TFPARMTVPSLWPLLENEITTCGTQHLLMRQILRQIRRENGVITNATELRAGFRFRSATKDAPQLRCLCHSNASATPYEPDWPRKLSPPGCPLRRCEDNHRGGIRSSHL